MRRTHDKRAHPRPARRSSADAANCALVIIDYQPVQVSSIGSMDQDVLVDRVVHLARFGMLYRLPVVLSTVNVSTGRNQPTIAPLQDVLPGIVALDRTTINAWEDTEFKHAVRAAGRRKLIMAALWTEACLTFPSLAGLDRIAQAGGQPTSVVQVGCELQRDWARGRLHADPVRRGQPAGRGAQRARRQRGSDGPLTHDDSPDTPSAMSPSEVGWRRNWPDLAWCDAERRRRCSQ
jgi:hypothetical protein